MDPDIRNIPVRRLENTIDVFDKLYHITGARMFRNDINLARDVNRGLGLLAGGPDRHPPTIGEIRGLAQAEELWREKGPPLGVPRMLAVHVYHPAEDLGGILGLMNFDAGHIADLIDKGYADAVAHDCSASGCVLPSTGEGRIRS
jgi:hypothetical protein